jgi:molybdopterin molybdotransferase
VAELLTLEEAIALVLERARPLPAEPVPVAEAHGRVLAEPAAAAVDLPPFPSSAMDGFAVRSADVPSEFPVVERIPAGRPAGRPLAPGEAMSIATGGVVPEGADAVVPIELVAQTDNKVEISGPVASGDNVRARGGDVRVGDTVVSAGTRLGPAHIGALAAAGVAAVVCARRPVAAVVATGSELRRPGTPLEPGEIYEANGQLLGAALALAGAVVALVTTVADDEAAHRAALEDALRHDVALTSGGVSVGPHDLVRGVERDLGVEEAFWRVAVKPGKPVSFGTRGETLVFGLPGNPVSALVGFELFVRPALRVLEGEARPGPRWEQGRLARAIRRNRQRDELVRARHTTEGLEPLSGQESHMIVRSAAADVLVLVPRGEGELRAGESVRWLPL